MTIRIIFCTIFASVAFYTPNLLAQTVRFNEVLPSNKYGLQDEDGDYPDWFELKNTGSEPVDLEGYSVTDNQNEIRKWTFPEFYLPPGEFIVVYASGKDRKTIPQFYNTIIKEGDTWRYIIPKSEIPGWTDIEFNDTNWPQGPSGFGYGDNDDATILPQTISVFLRKSFIIDDTSDIHSVVLHIDFDDGFVAYLNGIEIARSNIGTPGIRPDYNQTAITYREAEMYLGGFPEKFPVDNFKGLIKPGENVLAIQVHNSSLGSSDFSAIPFLTLSGSIQPEITPPSFISEVSGGFHSNFKISAGGDSIYLYDPSGLKVDEFFINIMPSDISLGYKPGDYSSVFGFTEPSPWRENLGEPLEYSEPHPLVFYPAGGHYSEPLNLSLSSNVPEDSIFYTTDGSEPTRNALYYAGAITVNKTISIRARAFRTGKIPGETATHSYLIGEEKELPMLFISTDPANLFNNETGIYVKGSSPEIDFPYFGSNFWNDWEKPAHIEYYNYQDNQQFSIDAGIKIFGGYSRGHPQKSLSIFARSKYGDKAINARLFNNSSLEKFEAIVLRNSGNDWFGEGSQSGVLFRDLFMTSVGRDIGIDAQAGRPVVVYINGQYWGIHNMREKINEHFIADNHDKNPDEINLLEANAIIVDGTNIQYHEMINYLTANDIKQEEHYRHISSLMDIDEYIRYSMLQIYYYNGDWPGNNIKYWKSSIAFEKWRWILYDTDFGFGLWDFNKVYNRTLDFATTIYGEDWPNPPWSTYLLRRLLQNEQFKHRFINTFADHLNTTLLPDSLIRRIDFQSNEIAAEMDDHIQRWGGYYTNWTRNVNDMRRFATSRPYRMEVDILQFFKIYYTRELSLEISGCENAMIHVNTIGIKKFPWSGKYFDKIPIELIAVPPEGYRFVRWEGSLHSNSPLINPEMETNQILTAVFEPISPDYKTGVIINEVFYKGNTEVNCDDWVELFNLGKDYVDITDWEINDNSDHRNFRFKHPTILPPHEYLVVSRDQVAFKTFYPTIENITGDLIFGFSSGGDCIRLFNQRGEMVDSVCFSSSYPWPSEPNGLGYSLSLYDPGTDNSIANNWYVSKSIGGTPGTANLLNQIIEFPDLIKLRAYPNPFIDYTRIEIDLPSPGNTELSVTDLNGRTLFILSNKFRFAGKQHFDWSPGYLPSGIYLLKMMHPEGTVTMKLVK